MTRPLREMRPAGAGWVEVPSRTASAAVASSWWINGTTVVGSDLVMANLPGRDGVGLQWIVSVSDNGGRPARPALRRALLAFGMVGAEEDNHHPGVARHFWRPVNAADRAACECKASETTVVEPDRYRWTNPVDGPCRGCEMGRLRGLPCPLHGAQVTT